MVAADSYGEHTNRGWGIRCRVRFKDEDAHNLSFVRSMMMHKTQSSIALCVMHLVFKGLKEPLWMGKPFHPPSYFSSDANELSNR